MDGYRSIGEIFQRERADGSLTREIYILLYDKEEAYEFGEAEFTTSLTKFASCGINLTKHKDNLEDGLKEKYENGKI